MGEEQQKDYVKKVTEEMKKNGIFPENKILAEFLEIRMNRAKDKAGVDTVVHCWITYCEMMCCSDCKKRMKEEKAKYV